MKSQKGVTMISLIIYIASFLAVTMVVGAITTFFYGNVGIMDTRIGSSAQYNRINLYMLNECKKTDNALLAWHNTDSGARSSTPTNKDQLSAATRDLATETFITFEDSSGNKNSFIYVAAEKNLYYNSVKIGENIEAFKFKLDYSTGKTVLKLFLNVDGTAYTTEYVLAS